VHLLARHLELAAAPAAEAGNGRGPGSLRAVRVRRRAAVSGDER
jgi:hypothetical protein